MLHMGSLAASYEVQVALHLQQAVHLHAAQRHLSLT